MPDPVDRGRLQPCLLDRLTDHEPDKKHEARERRVFTLRQVRAAVLRDIVWLLNSPRTLPEHELADFPQARRSVLNYGAPDLYGLSHEGLHAGDLERAIRAAVTAFEPRLIRRTLEVRVTVNRDALGPSGIVIEVRGDLYATPFPDPLFFRTEFDLESGRCRQGGPNG